MTTPRVDCPLCHRRTTAANLHPTRIRGSTYPACPYCQATAKRFGSIAHTICAECRIPNRVNPRRSTYVCRGCGCRISIPERLGGVPHD